MSGKELIKLLEKNEWRLVRINGSHHIMQKDAETLSVPVHGSKDLHIGILNDLLKKAGLK